MNLTEIVLLVLFFSCFVALRLYSRKRAFPHPVNRQARLLRIRNASWLIQGFIGFTFLLGTYWVVAFLCGWPFGGQDHVRIVISHSHIYTSPGEMPGNIFALWLVKTGLGFASAVALFALFQLYWRGILFSARNITYIRFQGYAMIIGSLIDYQMQNTLSDMDWSTTPVFVGLLIIFIAWIMDEGRKIQEEQALTV